MGSSLGIVFLIGLALILANLAFFTESLLCMVRLRVRKTVGWCLLELGVYYLVTGIAAWGLERQIGQAAPQGWQFYAITAAMFVTLAFPGFIHRYLWKPH